MKAIAWILFLATTAVTWAQADTLLLDAIGSAPPNASSGLLRPRNGTTMPDVLGEFGKPASVIAAVGEPPITRWVYPGYTVYFEHELVLDVVVHRN